MPRGAVCGRGLASVCFLVFLQALKRNPATREDARWHTWRFPLLKMGSVPRPSES